ncbi:MAG: KilA-N domain-containing protein [Salinivirgaceae bacterium]
MIVTKSFGGAEIAFEPSVVNANVMVNATQMAKAFGKNVTDFVKIDSTRNFINAFCQTEDIQFENEFSPKGKLVKTVKGHNSINGTWMHRTVALKFAAWLDPFFEVWVYKTIDEILFSYSREQDNSISRAVLLQHELSKLERKADKNGDDFEKFIKLNAELTHERSIRANATKARFREIYRDMKPFFPTN